MKVMINYFFYYLKFLFTSTNQHGVHSPFVYAYVTKCLYLKSVFKGSKTKQVFLKSKAYFKHGKVQCFPDDFKPQDLTPRYSPPFDLVFFAIEAQHEVIDFVLEKKNIMNHSMILVEGIYTSKESQRLWKTLKKMPQITVTIDLFYCGALFFRKEQVKEHFKIRI